MSMRGFLRWLACCCLGGTPIVKSGTDFFDFTAIAIFPGVSSTQPNLLATALINEAGQRVGAAAIAAAAVATAPRSAGPDVCASASETFSAARDDAADEAFEEKGDEPYLNNLAASFLQATGNSGLCRQIGGEDQQPLLIGLASTTKPQGQFLLECRGILLRGSLLSKNTADLRLLQIDS